MRYSGNHIGAFLLLLTTSSYAQNLDDKTRTELNLSDSTCVVLYEAKSMGEKSNIFYYLPVNMHVALNKNNPEISLIFYDSNGSRGAIMHLLLTWWLSEQQEDEVRSLLHLQINDSAFVAGSVLVDSPSGSVQITGDNRVVKIMNTSMSQNSRAPVVPGSKLALSFRFNSEEADYIKEVVQDPAKASDGRLRMIFTYQTMIQDGFVYKAVEHEWILEKELKSVFNYLK